MFEMIWALFQACFSREHFLELIQWQYPKTSREYRLIEDAYDVAEMEFREMVRLTGDPYMSHLRTTTVFLFVAMYFHSAFSAELLAAALLHDLFEDFPHRWSEGDFVDRFGLSTFLYVLDVTKPRLSSYDYDKYLRNRAYRVMVSSIGFWSFMLKICDNGQNLLTLWAMPLWKQERVIQLALTFYHPLAQKNKTFPTVYRVVVAYAQVRFALCVAKNWATKVRCEG